MSRRAILASVWICMAVAAVAVAAERAAPPRRAKPPPAEITKVTTPGEYRHVGQRFTIRYPKDWQLVRVIENGQLGYIFTPEKGKTDPKDIRVSFLVWLIQLTDTSVVQGKDAVSILKHVLPLVQHEEPGMTLAGPIEKAKLGTLDAATATMHGRLKDKTGEYTLRGFVAEEADLVYVVKTTAPKDQYPSLRPTFDKMVRESRFGWVRGRRLERSLEERHITKPYKASVVSVVAESPKAGTGSFGTGFIITKSGYVLTNQHVVWDEKAKKPHEKFWVDWDDSLDLGRKPAKLIRWKRVRSAYGKSQWGTDVALLKIAPGDYKPMPLSPLLDVEVGDRVVTMGFPQRGRLPGVSLTASDGVVTRFNRGPDGKVISIYTTAAVTHGSSGGPCVSLVTGGVIGLNTFGQDVEIRPETQHLNDLINYFGVVPIGDCMREFPLPTLLALGHDGSAVDFFEAFGMSRYFTSARADAAAQMMAARAAKLRPDSADAHCQVAAAKMSANLDALENTKSDAAKEVLAEIVRACRRALACDKEHEDSLVLLAIVHLRASQFDEALRCATQAVAACPEAWYCHYMLGEVCYAQRKWDDAVRHALRAKQIASGLRPDPCILAGRAYYAKGDLDAGLKQYQEAARIHPANLVARLGVGAYYEQKKLTDQAVAAYRKILEDFRDNPVVLTRLGSIFYHAKRHDEAERTLTKAWKRFVTLGQPPAAEALFLLGQLCEKKADEDKRAPAYLMYSWLAYFHSRGPLADTAHIRLATLHVRAKRRGLASAHLKQAHKIRPDNPELKKLNPGAMDLSLSLSEIKFTIHVRYPLGLIARMILDSGCGFDLTERQAVDLIRKDKMPAAIVRAIWRSKGKGTEAPPTPGPSGELVGAWSAQGIDRATLRRWHDVFTFAKDGQFTSRRSLKDTPERVIRGTWRYDKTAITIRTTRGETARYPYKFISADVLILTISDLGGNIRFTRRR